MPLHSSLVACCLALCVLVSCSLQVHGEKNYLHGHQNHQQRERPANFKQAKQLGESNRNFTVALYHMVTKQQQGNVFFSPLSIHAILTMISLGAKEKTLNELNTGLFLNDPTKTKNGYQFLMQGLNSMTSTGVTVKVANKIFVGSSFTLNPRYKQETKASFYSDTENVDFGNSVGTERTINSWVATNTENKIKEVISPGSLSPNTAMVLVNTLYFKGIWKVRFAANETEPKKFYVTPDKPVEVQMMHANGDFNYRVDLGLDCAILNLPYKNDLLSMLIILPNTIDGLAELESKLTPEVLKSLPPPKRQRMNVNVHLPKFKLEELTPLNQILSRMGMASMFSNSANLTGMLDRGQGLKVSDVFHKSFVDVNEAGTEAAAVTIAPVQTLSLSSDDEPEFNADHPFIFILRHVELQHILFMGRYVAPPSLQN